MAQNRGKNQQPEDKLIKWVETGDVNDLRKFMFPLPDAATNFHRSVLLYSTYDDNGSTLLQIAVENGRKEIVKLLLSHQDDATCKLTCSLELVSRVLLLVYFLDTLSREKSHDGLYRIDAQCVKKMMDFLRKHSVAVPRSTDPAFANFIGDDHLLASYDEFEDPWRIVLLWAFAKNDSRVLQEFESNFKGAYDLFKRIFSKREEQSSSSATKDLKFFFVRLVQALQFEMLHARSRSKFDTALHTATLTQHADPEMAHILLKYYDDLADNHEGSFHFLDVYSMTPLHYAVMLKSEPLITKLLNSKTYAKHLNAKDWCLRTPLHLACALGGYEDPTNASNTMQPSDVESNPVQGSLEVVKLLVNDKCRSVDLNAKDCCGFTPLLWALHVRAFEVVLFLLKFQDGDRTIRTTEKDVDEKSMLQYCVEDANRSAQGGNDVSSREAKRKEAERLLMSQAGVKDEIDILYRDRQVFVDAANAILVGAALIASVTYGGWLQPPAGADDNLTIFRLKIFWVFNSLSFFFAIATVMAGAGAVLPMAHVYIGDAVERVRDLLALTSLLLVISITFVLGAFAAAGFVSQSQFPDLGGSMAATTGIGSLVCSIVGLVFLRGLFGVSSKEWLGMRLTKSARRLSQQLAVFRNKEKVKVRCTSKDLDSQGGGNARVWHIHFAMLIIQVISQDDTGRGPVILKHLDRTQLDALTESWKGLIGNFLNAKYGPRPVIPACAHGGERGVQHAILYMSGTSFCRQSCRDRDLIFLRGLRGNKGGDIQRWFAEFETFVQSTS